MQGFEQRDKYKRFYQASQDKSTVEPRFTYTDITLLCTQFSLSLGKALAFSLN